MGLKKKLEKIMVGKIAAYVLKGAAEGRYGPTVKAVYWKTVGLKTYTGIGLATLSYLFGHLSEQGLCAPCEAWQTTLYTLGGTLIGLGLVDNGVRIEAPKKPVKYMNLTELHDRQILKDEEGL